MKVASTNEQLEEIMRDPGAPIARSAEAIESFLIDKDVSGEVIKEFSGSIEFREIEGLSCWTTWKYDGVREALSDDDFVAFLSKLGLSLELFYRMENRYCGRLDNGLPACLPKRGWVCFTQTCIL